MRFVAIFALVTTWLCLLSATTHAQGEQPAEESGGVLADEVTLDDLTDVISLEEAVGLPVEDIRIRGLGRTSADVVERELFIARGRPMRVDDMEESIQRLWNTALFRDVRYKLTRTPGGVTVWLAIGERWTTIPIVKFGGGGGSTFFIVGVYDPNVFGEYIELGGQYQNTNLNTHSGVVWFRDPRFLGLRLRWSAELWYINIVRPLYRDRTNVLEGGYNQERLQIFNAFDYEVVRYVQVGVGFEINNDRFNTRNLTDDQQAANEEFGLALPSEPPRTVFAEARLILGRLDRDEFLFQGVQMTNRVKRASRLLGSELDLNFIHSETLAFLRLPWRSNLATRITVGHNNTDADQHLFFIGGLDYMRGFFDGQLRGHNFWQANVEYRIPSVDTSWVVLQHVGFADIGDVSDSFGDLATFERSPRASVGAGIRLMSPRIYRLTVRLDYAVTLTNETPQAISFSAAQFF